MSILDQYCSDYPSVENAVRIFQGEWASDIPNVGQGNIPLFSDHRMRSIVDHCGGLTGKKCLELGPLEGGHTYSMWRSGASSILSIEANQRAFLKCLITKEIMRYKADFLLGDFLKYVATTKQHFDFTNMLGVLYHMTEPHELIWNVARISNQVGVWTHYYDEDLIMGNNDLSPKFEAIPKIAGKGGMEVSLYKQKYLNSLEFEGFCGGKEEVSYWMKKSDILELFEKCGFTNTVLEENMTHPHGPCFTFVAQRNG